MSIIERTAIDRLERLFRRVEDLEGNDYYSPLSVTANVSTPPTLAQITALFGAPNTFIFPTFGIIRDTTSGVNWVVVTDKINWYYSSVTRAL